MRDTDASEGNIDQVFNHRNASDNGDEFNGDEHMNYPMNYPGK
jgi:hypothetical protein